MRFGKIAFLGWVGASLLSFPVTPASAQANLPFEILLGKWCTDVGSYTFTRKQLTVRKKDGVVIYWKIANVKTSPTRIEVHWTGKRADGLPNFTTFTNFSNQNAAMSQAAETVGDKGPQRNFKRC